MGHRTTTKTTKGMAQSTKRQRGWILDFRMQISDLKAQYLPIRSIYLNLQSSISMGHNPADKVAVDKSLWDQATAMACRRRTRSSTGGWVLNQLAKPPPLSGLTMNMCAVAGLASCMGMRFEA